MCVAAARTPTARQSRTPGHNSAGVGGVGSVEQAAPGEDGTGGAEVCERRWMCRWRMEPGVAWHGMAWHGMAWHGTAQYGMALHGTARHGTARHGTARHGTARHGMAWRGTAQYGMAWHGMA
eukprot:350435-Chlamydomonas_euryale.AAC.3